jgi:hypothetical protein
VNFDLIRSWLGLPPGPWPPDHYTLLGFPPGHSDAAAFEPRVLQQMERLRKHQLREPDIVTEGMNRLAQALITLTDSIAKSAYDAELKFTPTPPQIPVPTSPPPPHLELVIVSQHVFEDLLPEAAEPVANPPTEVTQEIAVPEELIPPYELRPDPWDPRLEPSKPLLLPPKEITEAEAAARAWPTPRSSRRWIYARLASIRRGRRSWLKLRPVFLDPNDPLDRPARVVLLLEAATAIRPLLPTLAGVVGGVSEPGGLVAAVVRQPLLLDTIRRLLPDQRQALAADWRFGLQQLEIEYERWREAAIQERSKAEGITRTPLLFRWFSAIPELALIGFACFILLLSLILSKVLRSS